MLTKEQKKPRRFRIGLHLILTREELWVYGCYFPLTDLCVTEDGVRSTGMPKDNEAFEWIDSVDDLPWIKNEQTD